MAKVVANPSAVEKWLKILGRFSRSPFEPGASATIRRGKIEPPSSCEINAVDHCNLSCLDCNHAAPGIKERFSDPKAVSRDLSILAKCYRPRLIKVLGGEPLLHPNLKLIIDAVRESKICDNVLLLTNGLLLGETPDEIWDAVDGIELSVYPNTAITKKDMSWFRRKGLEHGTCVRAFYYEHFRVTMSMVGTDDSRLTRRIFETCKLGNEWGCHSIHNGYFYRCPQSIYISQVVNDSDLSQTSDGFRIEDSVDFKCELYRFLNSKNPLKSCRYCLGNIGKFRTHKTVERGDWLSLHRDPTEELVDFERLRRSETGAGNGGISLVEIDENSDFLSG
jgi:cyclic pyranopterin phosphate synthase